LPGGIVLTGGGSKLPKIKDLIKRELKLPCEIGTPSGIVGIEEDPALATVCGLVIKQPASVHAGCPAQANVNVPITKAEHRKKVFIGSYG